MLPWKCGAILSLVSVIELRFILHEYLPPQLENENFGLHSTRMKTDPRERSNSVDMCYDHMVSFCAGIVL